MAETDNDEYAFRLASYFRTRQDIIDRNPTAASFKNEEQLLEYYELDPRKRESGDAALYDLVKGAIKDSWTTGTLPHTKWEIKDTKSAGAIKIDVLKNSVPATLTGAPINLLTGEEYDLVFDESMVEGTGDNRKKKFNTVVYAIQEIPSTQSETVKVTSVNPKYYKQMALFMAYRDGDGKPFAERTADGRIARS